MANIFEKIRDKVGDVENKIGEVKTKVEENWPVLKTVLDALAARVAPPGEIPEKLADDLKAILGQLLLPATVPNPIDENKVRDSLDRLVNYLDHFNPEAVAKVLAEKLKITPPSTPQTSEGLDKLFRSPSPTQVLDLIQLPGPHDRMISLRNAAAALSWTGAMPGIEFGFFDVGESGVRSVRLSPLPLPPYLPPPVYSALGYFFFGIIGALVGASADYGPLLLAEILYSAFPGYPAFFDVPLEEGAPLMCLPVAWDEQMSNPLPIWPTSGSLPRVPGGIEYLPILSNLRSILAEDFGSLTPPRLELQGLPAGSAISALTDAIASLPSAWDESNLSQFPPKNLAVPTIRVVRPTALAFPEGLLNPAPVMISDPRRSRAFLLVPREGDSKNTLAVLGPQTKKEATASEPRQIDWYATPLYHSEAGQFLQIANRRGISDLYESAAEGGSLQAGGRKNGFDDSFVVVLPPAPSGEVVRTDCVEGIHFTGATGVYN